MIEAPIKTAFPWYDDIDKQNRYKSNCASLCDFKLLTPLNTIPPFEIRTGENLIEVTSWKVYCIDGSLADDITAQATIAGRVVVTTVDGQDYLTYNGTPLEGGVPSVPALILSCGTYYSVIETNETTYYSELFYCEDFEDPAFVQSDFPLFTPWRWYDDQQKQSRYKGACEANCNFYLLTGNDALLPFMFRKPSVSNTINSWVLRDLDGTCEHNLDTSVLNITVKGLYDYIYYNGEDIEDLPCGTYESIITINGTPYYSELIKITSDFSSNGTEFYLLQEDGFKILQETNFGILLE
jgi:hypothetical protein